MSSKEDSVAKSIAATKVEYKRLGNSGLKVSVPILGAMSFGDSRWMPWVLDEDEGLPLLKAAYDRGLNTWDTANIYSNGASEEIIGKALQKYSIPRRKVILLTKCFATLGEEPQIRNAPGMQSSKDYVNQGGLSRGAIFRSVGDSLRRLDTDYIDLFQIHRFDPDTPVEETMKALHDLVMMGKINYIGASSMFAYQFASMQFCAEKNGWTKFVSMQNHYSLIYREEEREMNKFCRETGVGLIPWAPLARGILARPPQSTDSSRAQSEAASSGPAQPGHRDCDKAIVERVQELAEKKGWPMSHVALAWIKQYVTSPIIGFSSVERIDEACGITGKEVSEEESKYLEELYEPQNISGHQ